MLTLHVWLYILLTCLDHVQAYYIPGWSIKSYEEHQSVPLYVNKVFSDSSELPYAYYELPFVCQPSKDTKKIGLNLGEVLGGDRIAESDFKLKMNEKTACETLCERKVSPNDMRRAAELITKDYKVEWIVDNLPGATMLVSVDHSSSYYSAGFGLGTVTGDAQVLIYNHFLLVFRYRESPTDKGRNVIVGFEVYPKSVSTDSKLCPLKEDSYEPFIIDLNAKDDVTIRYTYSVVWVQETGVQWHNRWDRYLNQNPESDKQSRMFHWFSIINSAVITAVLTLMVGIILIRTLYKDIQNNKTRQLELDELASGGISAKDDADLDEDLVGWKLVHGDVFRGPQNGLLLSALLGSGAQCLGMFTTVLGFACIGILNPSYRGGLLSYALFLFAFSGIFAGYVNGRMLSDLKQEQWVRGVVFTAFLAPAFIMAIVLSLNMLVWIQQSSSALPFGTIVALFAIWLLISTPLVIIGSFVGRKVPSHKFPTRVNQIPRQIPRGRSVVRNPVFAVLLGGVLPFLVIWVELMSIYKSIWQTKSSYYYTYGFVLVVFALLMLTVVEISVISTYVLLNSEDYNWWWRSFLVSSGSAWWVLFFSILYYFASLKVQGFVSGLLFFGYSLIGCVIYALVTGTIGFFASYLFVRNIYRSVKVD